MVMRKTDYKYRNVQKGNSFFGYRVQKQRASGVRTKKYGFLRTGKWKKVK